VPDEGPLRSEGRAHGSVAGSRDGWYPHQQKKGEEGIMAGYAPWPSTPPDSCPLEVSQDLRGIAFTGRHAAYTTADTWYASWASDGHLYSPWTDGQVGSWAVGSFGILAATAQAKIIGDDPLDLQVVPLGSEFGSPFPYMGRYPCGSLVKDGIWYYGTYCVDDTNRGLNWDVLGPFVGFRISEDFGLTWADAPHTPVRPLFGETGKRNGKVKIGKPHFVDFGQNMVHSPDGKAYLLSHGGTSSHANVTWGSGDEIYLIRVEPTPATINDPSSYEFFGGEDFAGDPVWTRDFAHISPLVRWPEGCGCVAATFNAGLGRYLMFVTNCWPTIGPMDTYVLESEVLTGPWRLASYMSAFGPQAYFVNLPSKFISSDGRSAWLCYSANYTDRGNMDRFRIDVGDMGNVLDWSVPPYFKTFADSFDANPPGSQYALCLQEIQFCL